MPTIWLQKIYIFGMGMGRVNFLIVVVFMNVRLEIWDLFMDSNGGILAPTTKICIQIIQDKVLINWLNALIKLRTILKTDVLSCQLGILPI